MSDLWVPGGALDALPPVKGHWLMNVYEGDIERDDYGRIRNPLVDQLEGENLVTTSGKGIILDRLFGLSAVGAITKLGVGTSNTAAAIGDTALTGVDYGPAAFDGTPTRASLTVTASQTYSTAQGNLTWAELGAFNAANVMLNRIAPIGPFTKTSAVSVQVFLQLTQS